MHGYYHIVLRKINIHIFLYDKYVFLMYLEIIPVLYNFAALEHLFEINFNVIYKFIKLDNFFHQISVLVLSRSKTEGVLKIITTTS